MAKARSKNSSKASNKSRKRRVWSLLWKLMLLGGVLLLAYLFYLDAQIKHSFSGNKWQVPAQIYARPLQVSRGEEITKTEIIDELKLLGYRKVSKADSSGEYSAAGNDITVVRRSFEFIDGQQSEVHYRLTWNGPKIANISDLSRATSVEAMQFEPWLVARLAAAGGEDRMLVQLEQTPPLLTQALVLVEDRDFYTHHGVAPLAIARALVANIVAGRTVQGGSTLTQQLVKNLYLTRERSILRKIREALMALVIDARYSKQEILQAYLNEVFLGQNGAMAVHGFGLASYFYFDRPVNELTAPEIATLVAMIKGPSYYNPRRYPERVLERRDLVLRLLFEHNQLSKPEYERAIQQPLGLASGASLASGKHPAFMDQVRRELKDILVDQTLRESGIKVFTTLDVNAQRRAEAALSDTLDALQPNAQAELNAAMIVTAIQSAEIRAMVGSRQTEFDGFNRALDAHRPIGSLVKPAVYLTALEDPTRYNLATPLEDKPIQLKSTGGSIWAPQNADRKFRGQVPLVDALVNSLNVPTVNLGMALDITRVADTLHLLGVKQTINPVPALALGALSLSVFETNQMYQTLANAGEYRPLHAVSAVMSADNELLWQHAEYAEQRVDEAASYLVNYGLYRVTQQGTAKALGKKFGTINMAGKTGTTDDYRDSWFSGFDRNVLTTVWVGNDDNKPIGLTGASGALPIFMAYQSKQEPKSLSRRMPQGLGIAHFDAVSGEVVVPGCADILSVPAILDVLPPAKADCYGNPVEPPKPEKKKSWWERLLGR